MSIHTRLNQWNFNSVYYFLSCSPVVVWHSDKACTLCLTNSSVTIVLYRCKNVVFFISVVTGAVLVFVCIKISRVGNTHAQRRAKHSTEKKRLSKSKPREPPCKRLESSVSHVTYVVVWRALWQVHGIWKSCQPVRACSLIMFHRCEEIGWWRWSYHLQWIHNHTI